MMDSVMWRLLKWGVAVAILAGSVAYADPTVRRLSVPIPTPAQTIEKTDSGPRVIIEGFGTLQEPGVPRLPVRIVPLAIPPGATVVRVTYAAADPFKVPLQEAVAPAPIWEPIGYENAEARAAEQLRFDANHASIYTKDEPYPASPVQLLRTAAYRGYDLVDLRVTPVAYLPLSRQLLRYTEITAHVDYILPELRSLPVCESSTAVEVAARELILNHEQASTWCVDPPRRDTEPYEFVVITLEGLEDDVSALVEWEQQKGRTVQVVTTQWIAANYTGVDLAQRIRNFLRDKYSAGDWGIEHLLLVGHYDDLPMREVWQDLGYGRPQTDTYYAELSLPDSQSWDSDEDGRYAEDEDQIDFYTEISVGRIPFSDSRTVNDICRNAVDFEQDHDPSYKRNILLAGSFFWQDTDTAVLMEAIAALPHLDGWTATRMYEAGYSTYSMDYDISHANLVSEWSNNKYAVVSWGGHGSPTSAHRMYYGGGAFIMSEDCSVLDERHPSIIFADSCYTSIPPSSLGREMLRQAAVGYVGATQVAGGRRGWESPADGSSQTLNYLFTGYVSSGIYTQGEALQLALRQSYLQGAWRWPHYESLEWGALYGNPDLGVGTLPALHIQFPEGLPDYLSPDVETTFVVRIDPILDSLVTDSATLHYRLDGGTFQSVPLSRLDDKLFEASLPPVVCDSLPEFYVSAGGLASGVVTQPENAPLELYSATVGSLAGVYHDDFEQDRGWLAENLGAADGDWERGVPVNDPNWSFDPFSDADGSGQCYLTANRAGNSDVYAGSVRLTSPVVDMTAANILLRYAYYLYAEDQADADYLQVEISSNDLAGPWHEVALHIRNNGLTWRIDSFTASDLQALGIDLTDRMRVRYTAHEDGSSDVLEAGVDAFEVLRVGCGSGSVASAGRVPGDRITPGRPLTLERGAGDQVTLDWGPSCLLTDVDYAVFEGAIGSYTSHLPVLCTTEGAMTVTITPGVEDRYYLVVPLGADREGSYKLDSERVERPPGAGSCLSQSIGECP